jgi:hypothetical protein
MEFLSKKYDELLSKVDALESEKEVLMKDNTILKSDLENLSCEMSTVNNNLNDMEQYSRLECLEIRGIPVRDQYDENTNAIVKNVGKLIGVNVSHSDISISHRLPKSRAFSTRHGIQYDAAIIVKFVRRDVRDSYYKARSNLRNKTTNDLGIIGSSGQKIFIAESLTQKNKALFNQCLHAKRDLKYKFLSTSSGKIFLRLDADSYAVAVCDESDIEKLYDHGDS